ncbi:MAG: (Fe-S)-binding protein, partial [Terriglobales bacterium]
VVYFPACVSRIFGVSDGSQDGSQTDVIEGLFTTAGVRAIYPQKVNQLCCGMAFASKGFFAAAQQKMEQLISELVSASQGVHPILIDTSPCASRLRTYASRNTNLRIYDISEFLLEKVVPSVRIQKARGPIGVHVPCSLKANGGDQNLLQLARLCAERVHIADSAPCCGFAGDRGFNYPELPASALGRFADDLPHGCEEGYSSSRTCELGISMHSGINFRSVAYLLDKVSTARWTEGAIRP